MDRSKGKLFKLLVQQSSPLQVVGTINAYSAILARDAGHKAIYLSGAGVANASYGMPDLGMTNLKDVAEDARRITSCIDLPLLVDIDTGWGHAFNIARTVQEMERADVAAIHIEDQVLAKRCGHRPNKSIVTIPEMVDRIKAAVNARTDPNFVIMARTDAYAVEGMDAAIERAERYIEAGADMIFPEAMASSDEYHRFCQNLDVPVLANITEFGKTPLLTASELARAGVKIALYPLSAFRSMAKAALTVYETILEKGSQHSLLDTMQTREELYSHLKYHQYEEQLDKLMEE
jgi:methylisocitrate lyase